MCSIWKGLRKGNWLSFSVVRAPIMASNRSCASLWQMAA